MADIEQPMGDRPCSESCPPRDTRSLAGNSATQKIEVKLSFEKILADSRSSENSLGNNEMYTSGWRWAGA